MKVKITVDSHVSFNWKKLKTIDSEVAKLLKVTFIHSNPKFYQLRRMGYPTWSEPQTYKSFKIEKNRITFTRGCLTKIKKILKKNGHTIKIINNKTELPPVTYNSNIILRDDQEPFTEAILKKKQGIALAQCSFGKTISTLEAVARSKQPAMIVVWNTDHQKQWIEEATNPKLLNLPMSDVGGVGGVFKKRKLGKLNICMQQSLNKKENLDFFLPEIGFLVADEGQRFGARTFVESINPIPAKYRITITADKKRSDKKDFLIDDTFGEIIYRAKDIKGGSRKEARVNLVISKFYSEDYEITKFTPDLLNKLAKNKKRNKLIISRALKKVNKKKIVLILVERRYQALYLREKLKNICRVELLLGKAGSKKKINAEKWPDAWKEFMLAYDADEAFYRIKKDGANKEIDITIASQKGDVGLNVKTFDHVIVTTPSKVERFNQQKGRGERNYDEELIKKFGIKCTPTVDYIWDNRGEFLRGKGDSIRKSFANVKVINTYNKRKKNGKSKK